MDFGNFGVVSFTNQAKSAAFVDHLAEGRLMGTTCKKCGKKYFPPRMDCAQCLDSDVDWFEIKGPGKLVTYSCINFGPSGFEEVQPYILGIVEFPEGVRVLAKISDNVDPGTIKTGMALKPVPKKLSEEKLTYEFET
ncbi:MAG: Zn-ribbon domain-containing OB-fold protein [Dehalococcoidia bacterium]